MVAATVRLVKYWPLASLGRARFTALVADDSSVNRRILARLLESAGARVIQAAGGIQITASHNPAQWNGLKLFGPDGYKLSDEIEGRIEPDKALSAAFADAYLRYRSLYPAIRSIQPQGVL